MASKSAQQEPEKAEVIEEALDVLDSTLDRVKVLYEQYFLGIQKQPPSHMHNDVERKLRDLSQMQIRNTALRYRMATLQQKFGSYNTYWRRTLRQIENGTYKRSLARVGRQAARSGEAVPEEILAAMPKLMRERVKRDRENAVAAANRRQQPELEQASLYDDVDVELDLNSDGIPMPDENEHTQPFDEPIAVIAESHELRQAVRQQAHAVDPDDIEMDLEAFFSQVERIDPAPALSDSVVRFRPPSTPTAGGSWLAAPVGAGWRLVGSSVAALAFGYGPRRRFVVGGFVVGWSRAAHVAARRGLVGASIATAAIATGCGFVGSSIAAEDVAAERAIEAGGAVAGEHGTGIAAEPRFTDEPRPCIAAEPRFTVEPWPRIAAAPRRRDEWWAAKSRFADERRAGIAAEPRFSDKPRTCIATASRFTDGRIAAEPRSADEPRTCIATASRFTDGRIAAEPRSPAEPRTCIAAASRFTNERIAAAPRFSDEHGPGIAAEDVAARCAIEARGSVAGEHGAGIATPPRSDGRRIAAEPGFPDEPRTRVAAASRISSERWTRIAAASRFTDGRIAAEPGFSAEPRTCITAAPRFSDEHGPGIAAEDVAARCAIEARGSVAGEHGAGIATPPRSDGRRIAAEPGFPDEPRTRIAAASRFTDGRIAAEPRFPVEPWTRIATASRISDERWNRIAASPRDAG